MRLSADPLADEIMKVAFLLEHVHSLAGGEEVKTIGIYSSRVEAEAAVARLACQPGFADAPSVVDDGDGFYISKYEIDRDNWGEGFVTV